MFCCVLGFEASAGARPMCPEGWSYDTPSRLCTNGGEALGPFTQKMISICKEQGGGDPCENRRWGFKFAQSIRGSGVCPLGSTWNENRGACSSGDHVYGPFSQSAVDSCRENGGGEECNIMRWSTSLLPLNQRPNSTQKLLNVPYYQQYDNRHEPNSTCNLTSVAMVLNFWGIDVTPDEVYERVGSPVYTGSGMLKAARSYGVEGVYSERGSRQIIKDHLDEGRPVILQGWFSKNGHIVVITGYDAKGWIVNDPAGKWKQCTRCGYGDGASLKGKSMHYSYESVEDAATDPGNSSSYWITVVWKS